MSSPHRIHLSDVELVGVVEGTGTWIEAGACKLEDETVGLMVENGVTLEVEVDA